jgi:hypothetical protein
MIISYAASAQVSLESEAGVQSVDVGGDADQSSLALGTLCHISVAGSTGVQTSGVSGIGSHFLTALQVVLKTVLIKALLD